MTAKELRVSVTARMMALSPEKRAQLDAMLQTQAIGIPTVYLPLEDTMFTDERDFYDRVVPFDPDRVVVAEWLAATCSDRLEEVEANGKHCFVFYRKWRADAEVYAASEFPEPERRASFVKTTAQKIRFAWNTVYRDTFIDARLKELDS